MYYPDPTRTRPLFESWTRTRLGRDRPDCTRPDRHILHSKCYEVNKRKKKNLFALTTVSSPLPDCDAYNPPCQYISIHVRLFLSLAVWKSLIHSLFQLQKYLLSRRRMTNATSQFFFHLESTSIVTFTLLNYNNNTFCWL